MKFGYCPHDDVRYFAHEKGAVACCDCARLFGHLRESGEFIAFNPDHPGWYEPEWFATKFWREPEPTKPDLFDALWKAEWAGLINDALAAHVEPTVSRRRALWHGFRDGLIRYSWVFPLVAVACFAWTLTEVLWP